MFFKIENYGSGRAIREHGDLAVISVWCIRTECIHFYVIEGLPTDWIVLLLALFAYAHILASLRLAAEL